MAVAITFNWLWVILLLLLDRGWSRIAQNGSDANVESVRYDSSICSLILKDKWLIVLPKDRLTSVTLKCVNQWRFQGIRNGIFKLEKTLSHEIKVKIIKLLLQMKYDVSFNVFLNVLIGIIADSYHCDLDTNFYN